MVQFDQGATRVLLDAMEKPSVRRAALILATFCLLLSFALVWFIRLGHFFSLSFVTVIIFSWVGGWRMGLTSGLAIPLLALPVQFALGLPPDVIFRDTLTFLLMLTVCGGAVGLLSTLFRHAVSTEREIKRLYGFLPICSHCHRIRQDDKEWISLESFFNDHAKTQLSHGICPICMKEHYDEETTGGYVN